MFQSLVAMILQSARAMAGSVLLGPGSDSQATQQQQSTPRQSCGTITWVDE